MTAKRKITPFGRFVLMLIVVVPLSFFVASYINGEDPIENLKDLPGLITGNNEVTTDTEITNTKYDDYTKKELIETIMELKEDLEDCHNKQQ